MKIEKLIVPNGIRYISDWSDYSLEHYQFPHILNKTITGCGYTEYCIKNKMNVILCSPRRILLENKEDQHSGEVYYVRNDIENQTNFEKDFSSKNSSKAEVLSKVGLGETEIKEKILKLKDGIKDYYSSCQASPFREAKPCKILVTYDSFRHVKEALGEDIEKFYVVIDEFQSIFTDAKFKSNTELEFVNQLKDLQKVCYVSATPMLTKYLEMLDEFKDLPYFELDWVKEDPGRVIKPQINVKYCGKRNTIQSEIKKVVEKYRSGVYEVYRYRDENGLLQEIQSKEAVIYVNSVVDITKAIKLNKLTLSECNILISKTDKNSTKIQRAFGLKKSDGPFIGTVPKLGEKHKMFTFCTRTVYLGADFYSTNARSFIFSNANIDCLSVDISLDLPQILGRQRLIENPWKNSADLYVTLKYEGEKSKKEYQEYMAKKEDATSRLLRVYKGALEDDKDALAEKYEIDAKNSNYKRDYVAVNHHSGSSMLPVFNKLMQVAEMRTFEIQEYDYADRVSVLSRIDENYNISENKDKIDATVNNFKYQYTTFVDKMKYLCSQKENLSEDEYSVVLSLVPMEYSNYITTLGIDLIKSKSYKKGDLDIEFKNLSQNQLVSNALEMKIINEFNVGKRYTKVEIKEKLREIYSSLGYKKTPKATDLEQWFEIKSVLINRKDNGFEIIKKKGD